MKDFSLEMTLVTSIQTINQTLSNKPNLTAREAGNCRGGEAMDYLVSHIIKATAP